MRRVRRLAIALVATACGTEGPAAPAPPAPTPFVCSVVAPTDFDFDQTVVGGRTTATIPARVIPAGASCPYEPRITGNGFRVVDFSTGAVVVEFAPTTPALHEARLELIGFGVNLRGEARDPNLAVTPDRVDFGPVPVGCGGATARVALANPEDVAVEILTPRPRDAGAPFEIVLPEGDTIPARGELPVEIRFSPTEVTPVEVLMDVKHRRGSPLGVQVTLRGSGEAGPTVEDVFRQISAPKVDALIVVSSAASMGVVQSRLRSELDGLTKRLACSPDVRYAVIDADIDGALAGQFVDPGIIDDEDPNLLDVLADAAEVGTGGTRVAPLEAAYLALTPPLSQGENAGFARPDALGLIAIVADTDDDSPRAVEAYVEDFVPLGDPVLAIAAGETPDGCQSDDIAAAPAPRLAEAAPSYPFAFSSVCHSGWWLSPSIVDGVDPFCPHPRTTFALSRIALPSTVRVFVDEVEVPRMSASGTVNWSATANEVHFSPFGAPPYDATFRVEYAGPACP